MAKDRQVSFTVTLKNKGFIAALDQSAKRMERFGRNMERTGKKMTTALTLPIIALGGAAAKSAMDFESAFAGVRKTIDATESQFAGLRKGILNMSKELPTTANEIAGVAESAGQLGIKTENILSFSKTMVMLGDTTNMVASEAATSFARIANVMQLPQDQFDRMGSAVVDLGNNFATTEAEIVEFANRIAGAGKIAGLSADQVFAIGTALSSVGIRAESGGTAVQKALLNMNDAVARGNSNLQVFAETAGMSAAEFQKAWREDSGAAFTAFVNGLGRQGDNATAVLEQVGLNSERVRATFLSLSGAGDLLNRTMDTGSTAWQQNTALTKEAQQRYDTFASRLAMFRNQLTSVGIVFGDMILPALSKLIERTQDTVSWIDDMSDGTKQSILFWGGFAAALGPAVFAMGKMVRTTASLVKVMRNLLVLNPWTWIGAIALAAGALTVKLIDLNVKAKKFKDIISDALNIKVTGSDEELKQNAAAISLIGQEIAKFEEIAAKAMQRNDKAGAEAARSRVQALREEVLALVKKREEIIALQSDNEDTEDSVNGLRRQIEELNKKIGESFDRATIIAYQNEIKILEEQLRRLLESDPTPPSRTANSNINISKREVNSEVNTVAFASEGMPALNQGFERFIQNAPGLQELNNRIIETAKAAEELAMKRTNIAHLTDIANTFTNSFGHGLANVIVQGEKLVDTLKNIGKLLASSVIQKGLSILLTGGLGGTGFFGSGGGLFGKIFGVNDALITSQGDVVKFHPDDNLLAMKDFSKLQTGGAQSITVPVYLDGLKIFENQVRVEDKINR